MSDRELPGIQPDKPGGTQPKRKFGYLGVALVAVVSIGAFVLIGSLLSNPENAAEPRAISECQRVVKANLKSPSSASFSSTATGGDGSYVVTGTVESENAFGVRVQAEFKCAVGVVDRTASADLIYLNE